MERSLRVLIPVAAFGFLSGAPRAETMDVALENTQRDDALFAKVGNAIRAYGQRTPAHVSLPA